MNGRSSDALPAIARAKQGSSMQTTSDLAPSAGAISPAAGPLAVKPIPPAARDRTGNHVDSGRVGSHDCRRHRSGTAKPGNVTHVQRPTRRGGLVLRAGSCYRSLAVRLDHGPETLCTYLAGVLLSSLAWDFASFACFRGITGLGIGGEYAAVNSASDELIPAKYRGKSIASPLSSGG